MVQSKGIIAFVKANGYFILFIFIGIVFRTLWTEDMEWKVDEKLMLELASQSFATHSIPWIGMQSGGGIVNAGFSIWPFSLFYFFSKTALGMAQWVQWSNVLALFVFILCIRKQEVQYRKILFLGLASYAVALMPVVFSRKIWAQDLLPLFIACMWYLYCFRSSMLALGLLGLVSALAGQLHLSGYYYAFGLFIVAFLSKQVSLKNMLFLGAGCFVGMLAAVPWVKTILLGSKSQFDVSHIFKLEFWMHSAIDPLGINVFYSLGKDAIVFAKFPYFFGIPSFLPATIAILLFGILLFALVKQIQTVKLKSIRLDWNNPMAFLGVAFVVIPGLLLTVSGIPIRSHYLIGALPFLSCILLQILGKIQGKWQVLFIALQACITFLFLSFVHTKQNIKGDYGKTYKLQEIESVK